MANVRWRRWLARSAGAAALLFALLTPLAFRYTSVGCEWEWAAGPEVVGEYWRLRWPGDGSVALVWLRERRAAGVEPPVAFDLGAAIFEPAPDLQPVGWQRAGFWWVVVAPGEAPPPVVAGAEQAWLLGVPQWGLALVAALVWWWARRR